MHCFAAFVAKISSWREIKQLGVSFGSSRSWKKPLTTFIVAGGNPRPPPLTDSPASFSRTIHFCSVQEHVHVISIFSNSNFWPKETGLPVLFDDTCENFMKIGVYVSKNRKGSGLIHEA